MSTEKTKIAAMPIMRSKAVTADEKESMRNIIETNNDAIARNRLSSIQNKVSSRITLLDGVTNPESRVLVEAFDTNTNKWVTVDLYDTVLEFRTNFDSCILRKYSKP